MGELTYVILNLVRETLALMALLPLLVALPAAPQPPPATHVEQTKSADMHCTKTKSICANKGRAL